MSIFDMISVNAAERFDAYNTCVKHQFQYLHDQFWRLVRNDEQLSDLHFAVVNYQCLISSEALLEAYMVQCQKALSTEVFLDLTKEFDYALMHQQIVNLESLDIDPLTKEAVYIAMERADEQHEFDCLMDSYRNEY